MTHDASSGESRQNSAAAERAHFLETVLDSATDYAIVTTDREGMITGWNSGAEHVLGWRPNEILGRPSALIFTEEDRRAGVPAREMAEARSTSKAPDERWHRRKDGRQFWASGSMMRIVDEETGEFRGYLKIMRDRTQDRLEEERRRIAAALLREVVASSGDCIKVLDLDGRVVFINEMGIAAMEIVEVESFLSRYWPDIWPGEGRQAAETALAAARSGGVGRFTGFAPTLGRTPKWWDVQVTPIAGPDGVPERFLCISRDTTMSTLADRSLAASEARWRGLFERMQEGFFLAEAIRDDSGRMVDFRFVEINPAFEDQTGLKAAETVGRSLREAIPSLPEGVFDIYADVVRGGEPRSFEIHVPGLGERWYEARARRESAERFAVLFLDITARKMAEAETRKLASIVEQSEDFVGIALPDGRLDFVNAAGRRIVGLDDLGAVRTRMIGDCLAADEGETPVETVTAALGANSLWQGELVLRHFTAPNRTPVLCDIFPIKDDGRMVGWGIVARDLTERKKAERRRNALIELGDRLGVLKDKAEMAYAAAAIMGRTLEVDLAGYGEMDRRRETVTIERGWNRAEVAGLAGVLCFADYGSYIGQLRVGETVVVGDARLDPRTADKVEALRGIGVRSFVNLPIMEGGRFVALFYLADAGPRDWSAEEVSFIRNIAERTRAAVERLRAEEQQLILNRELSHRMKNMLAMVQSIATQTLRNSTNVDTARKALSDRLVALGKAHDVLLDGAQAGAGILAIIAGTVRLHGDGQSERFRLDGPDLAIGTRAALPLALMLHELATNAVKYGALSNDGGHVSIEWSVSAVGQDAMFALRWIERDGPPVTQPQHKGFGSRLIERALAGQFGGEVALDFRSSGVACTLTAPLPRLQAEE